MVSLRLEKENIIKGIRHYFRLKRKKYTAIKDITNLLKQEKKLKQLKIEY